MAARDFLHVGEVQSSVHVRGKIAVEKIDDDSSSRSRLYIALANRCRWIHYHDRRSRAACGQNGLLSHELRALVVADHVRQIDRRALIHDTAVRKKSHSGNRTRVNDA